MVANSDICPDQFLRLVFTRKYYQRFDFEKRRVHARYVYRDSTVGFGEFATYCCRWQGPRYST